MLHGPPSQCRKGSVDGQCEDVGGNIAPEAGVGALRAQAKEHRIMHYPLRMNSCVTMALLAGCGGSQPPIGAPGAVPQSRAVATHVDRGGSWMQEEAKGEYLLYVTNYAVSFSRTALGRAVPVVEK